MLPLLLHVHTMIVIENSIRIRHSRVDAIRFYCNNSFFLIQIVECHYCILPVALSAPSSGQLQK
jgi:hypothetical protein